MLNNLVALEKELRDRINHDDDSLMELPEPIVRTRSLRLPILTSVGTPLAFRHLSSRPPHYPPQAIVR